MGSGAKLCTKRSREEWKDAGPSENDEELLDAICDFDPDPGAAEDLHAAITGLLASGASADTRNSLGNCLHNLLYSAEAQELPPSVFMRSYGEVVELLARSTDDLDARGDSDSGQWTALMICCHWGNVAAAEILLDCGASAKARNRQGKMAFELLPRPNDDEREEHHHAVGEEERAWLLLSPEDRADSRRALEAARAARVAAKLAAFERDPKCAACGDEVAPDAAFPQSGTVNGVAVLPENEGDRLCERCDMMVDEGQIVQLSDGGWERCD